MSYKQLTLEQRYQISALWKAGHTQKYISEAIGVDKSTICRELKRNRFWRGTYEPHHAHSYAQNRHRNKQKAIKFTQNVEAFVREQIVEEWSPEQISGYAKRHDLFSISHERIYQFILQDKKYGGELYKHLRHQHKKYRKRYGSPQRHYGIKNRKFIDERPKVVDNKERIGDWEIDTIIGGNRKQAIVTIVERVSKKSILKKVEFKTAELVSQATMNGLKPISDKVLTITADNGTEFAYHERISQALDIDFYFARPYASWERGLNENTNGLVRQYLNKGCDFSDITDNDLVVIMDKLNNRPRKTLNYMTPNEVFNL